MMWFFAILVGLVLGVVATVAAGRVGHLPEPDSEPSALPDLTALDASALRRVRFPLAVRGYRMAEVDALLDAVAAEWERRDRQP